MSLTTSTHFASCIASGTDWRDTAKNILEQLKSIRTDNDNFNIGFLYVSDHLFDDMESILSLFRSVLHIEQWSGTVGLGVCGNGVEMVDRPAISAMIGHMPPEEFCFFTHNQGKADARLKAWMKDTPPMLVLAHADPVDDVDPALAIEDLSEKTHGFVVGGLSSSRHGHTQIYGDALTSAPLSGVAFAQSVKVATALSQGCKPLGPVHHISATADTHYISELDEKRALDVFEDDIRKMAMKHVDAGAERPVTTSAEIEVEVDPVTGAKKHLFKGEVHAAFPIPNSDQDDYLVRNLIGIDPDAGCVGVAQEMMAGDQIMFVHRDNETLCADLSSQLVALRKRVTRETGEFKPKAAIYVSCVARAFDGLMSGKPELTNDDGSSNIGEMKIVQDVIGDVPLTGFYAGGEISNARLYGYTGVLTLFL